MEGVTPLEKILKKLSSVHLSGNVIPIVIFATGSLNPIHNGHLDMFRDAKNRIEVMGK